MNLSNDHNVYILGAGFSREAGLPLISDFLTQMRDSHEWLVHHGRKEQASAVEKVLSFRLEAASAAYWVTLDLENIEELFSLASIVSNEVDRYIRTAIAATLDFARETHPLTRQPLRYQGKSVLFGQADATAYTPANIPPWAERTPNSGPVTVQPYT